MRTYGHVLAAALEHPWAITAPMLQTVATVLARRIAGGEATAADLEAVQAARLKREDLPQPKGGAVAVIPVYGVLAPRANLLTDISGGTSYERLTSAIQEALSNEAVSAIVLDVDSPGGSVAGATELARYLVKAREQKPIIAQAQYQMCSAAYWLASACTAIHAAPSALVGSIGVLAIHDDLSAALEREGIKRTFIFEGAHKVDGNSAQPLSAEALADIQSHLARHYAQFHADIAVGRGVSVAEVKKSYGDGRVFGADGALAAGMVDKVATLTETVGAAMQGPSRTRRAAALAEHAAFARDLFALHTL